MRSEYKRDMNHNYLILYGDQEVDTSSYQMRMLAGNVLPSILKCRIQSLDGKMMFYYEITSRQSISSFYEQKKFKAEDLRLIFGGFIQAMEEMGEYLLNPGQLVLDPDYVYLDVEKKMLSFCYLPGYEKEVREQFRLFTEYILPKLDHEDGQAVMLGYGIYRSALEDSFHLEYIKKELYQKREEIPEEIFRQNDVLGQKETVLEEREIPFMDDLWNREEKGNQKKHQKEKQKDNQKAKRKEKQKEKKIKRENDEKPEKTGGLEEKHENYGMKKKFGMITAVIVAVAVMLGILAANLLGYLPWLSVEIAMGTGLVLLGCGLLAYFASRRKQKKEQKNWREEVEKNRKVHEKQEAILGKGKQEDVLGKQAEETLKAVLEEPQSLSDRSSEPICHGAQGAGDFGETVVLSANIISGPAALVSREPGELATIYLKEELTIIGKLETACDAVISLPTVSRVHGKIRKRGEEYYLTDLNSRNGTSVNGRILKGDEEYQLQNEDEVDFAQARYVFLK